MPVLLKHIDAIAREKNRDVLFIHFENYEQEREQEREQEYEQEHAQAHEDVEADSIRSIVLAWLEDHGIGYEPCMGLEQDGFVDTYAGDIYIDLPFDESNSAYRELSLYLEDDQGNMMLEGVLFFVLALDLALEIEADRQASQQDEELWKGKPS